MTGRGGFPSMSHGQPRSAAMFGAGPTLQAGPSTAAQSGHDPRGRSFGGGSSSFNPFAHDGQGHYHNPYDINPVPANTNPSPSPGVFHSIGGSNKRRGQAPLAGAQSYEVPRLSPSPSTPLAAPPPQYHGGNLYTPTTASYPRPHAMEPTTLYQQQQSQQPMHRPHQPHWVAPPPLWNKCDPRSRSQNNNDEFQHVDGRPMSSDKYQQSSSQRPPSSRSTLGSAGAMAMMTSQDEPGYGYTDNNQRQHQPSASSAAPPQSHRPDIYHHIPSNVAPSPSKSVAQWSGTGNFGHSSTRISRPPGGHSQFVLG
ncbi:hypothetical protein, variant [Aphanomyces invadans]|uniref:Uncharacterized protein n=1 Tax=Aphanomyces invadans TaxID=157072 RepID=A0A024TI04_9STRA|nr:hypothetical protein, variant [Aphanomyces invadans]ETV93629.1 hypothetical protein, variant [Aphanomyces invadans]|eukprot:XP_008877669.1 hypothetical protein, variant [Aphanomyces invadans]